MTSPNIPTATLALVASAGGAPAEPVSVPVWLELVAIAAASVSGVLTAREKKLDLVGAVWLAVVCSLGGGLLRDMTLQVGDVYILNQPLALPGAIITAAVVFVIPKAIERQDKLIAVLDIFAVGLYAATGADKALVYGFNPLICIMMGFFTAVGGGMLRDICLGQTPGIFQRSNLYAVAAIAGAGCYVALAAAGVSHAVGVVVCVVVTMSLRWLSLKFNIMSPTEVDLSKVPLVQSGRRYMRVTLPRAGFYRGSRQGGSASGKGNLAQSDIDARRAQARHRAAKERLARLRRKQASSPERKR